MRNRRFRWCGGLLLALCLVAALAPSAGLRDPASQPDGLVLRNLPPLTRVDAILAADGERLYAHEIRPRPDGTLDYRRGTRWRSLEAEQLAGPSPEDWHRRPLFLLGTDGFGRDMLSRLVHGARVSLLIGSHPLRVGSLSDGFCPGRSRRAPQSA